MSEFNQVPEALPKLAPPGAGIPWPLKLILRYFMKPFVASRTPWEVSEKRFVRINQKILSEIEGLTEEQLSKKILVPPMRGLEDSSRFWSIKMVIEHLVIVSSQMIKIIPLLSNGQVPNGKADTATVKPFGQMTVNETMNLFKKLTTRDFENLVSNISNKKSQTTFTHPWFGPMTAQEWYWLLPGHHALHLKQIKAIKKSL